MITEYLFSSPEGDILLCPEDLRQPFLISPSQKHPFLFLGDYLYAVKKFILSEKSGHLVNIFNKFFDKDTTLDNIQKIRICSEKHGVLYHISSVEISAGDTTRKLCIISALSQNAKKYMAAEFELLRDLRKEYDYPYIPETLFMMDVVCNTGNGAVSFLMFCTEWFEDYHEWHLAPGKEQVVPFIWDMKKGHRFASLVDSFEIFRQIAFILTLYYNLDDFRQVLNWHNSAGDFIVRIQFEKIEVRLTTVRQYNPLSCLIQHEKIDPIIATIYFLFDTTLRIGLDKIDGTGDFIFAGQYALDATIKGFFDALKIKEVKGENNLGKISEFFSLLKSFNVEELTKIFQPLLEGYKKEDPEELEFIVKEFPNHISQLHQSFQTFRL